jgi:hypothetical protein
MSRVRGCGDGILWWSRKDFKEDSVQLQKVSRGSEKGLRISLSPVEDPVFDAGIVVSGGVACGRERVDDFGLPVRLDKGFKVFPISGSGVRNVMVGQPSL